MTEMEITVALHEQRLEQLDGRLKHIENTLDEIKIALLEMKVCYATPRGPSWAMAAILTALTSLCLSFIVFYFTRYVTG